MDTFVASIHLLRTRRFGTFWFASLLSNLGTWAQSVAEPWLLLSIGASSLLIGLDSFAAAAPVWILTLVGGLLADLHDRRRIIATCQSIQMLCPLMIVLLLVIGGIDPWIIIALSLVVGITDALSMPSFQTIVPTIVEPNQIASGLALNATQFNLSRTLGPAIAGLLMASVGSIACFVLNAASYIPFIWVALWILPRGKPKAYGSTRIDRRSLLSGIRSIVRLPHLRGALLTVFLTSTLCGPLTIFCPVLIKEVLHGTVSDFSIAISAFGIGGLIGAIALLGVSPTYDRRYLSSYFAVAYGVLLILVAVSPWILMLPLLLGVAGFSMNVTSTSANVLLQAKTSPSLRGQTVSLYMLAMRGGISVGSLMTGLSANMLGIREALLINGILAVCAQVVVTREWFRSPLPKLESC